MTATSRTLAVILGTVLLTPPAFSRIRVYVSPSGNDRWSGSVASPRADRSDGPVRSLERALEVLRATRSRGGSEAGTVFLRAGIYRRSTGVRLDARDNLTTIRPYRSERVTLTGSIPLPAFVPVGDTCDSRIARGLRDSIQVADLGANGIADYGTITPRGSPGLELFLRNRRMPLARWPNEGWVHIADVPQTGDSCLNPGLAREKRYDGVPAGRHYGRIRYAENRPNRWHADTSIYLHGYWTFDWSDSYQKIASIDTLRQEFHLSPPHHGYGYTRNQRYYALNVLEELDRPGEWYLDRTKGLLYFWPPRSQRREIPTASVLDVPFITLDSASHVAIENLTFTESRAGAVLIREGEGNVVRTCQITNLGGEAIRVEGGRGHGVENCNLHALGLGGITLTGGDRKTLTPAGHVAFNNHIHHFSEWVRTGQYAIILEGVGNRASHNEIHDSPFEALTLRGNDHVIEFNDIYRVTRETGDAGAFHTGRNWTWQGNIIRNNYFHDLQGPGLHGVMGVYLDDWACGFTVTGNVFYRAGRATMIGGGRNNTVENNIYIECIPAVHIDARGLGWAGYYFDGTRTELFDQMKDVHFDRPPYSTRYPWLLTMYDGETQVPKYNSIRNNVSWGGRWMDVYDYYAFDFSVVKITGNVIADTILLRRRKAGHTDWDPYYIDIDMKEGYEFLDRSHPDAAALFSGNRLVRSTGGSINPVSGTVRLPDTALPHSWIPIPFDKFGRVRMPSVR